MPSKLRLTEGVNFEGFAPDAKTVQSLLRHANANTTLDLYSQGVSVSQLAAQTEQMEAILQTRPVQ